MACCLISLLASLATICMIDAAVINEMPAVEEFEIDYFSEDWRKAFSNEQLIRQPKWTSDEGQPTDKYYEVRNYAPAWWVTSFTPCFNQTVSSSYGYLKLYLYMNKYNSRYQLFDLTYPILNGVSKDPMMEEDEMKGRNPCPDKYSVNFYLPHDTDDDDNEPPMGNDETVLTSESDSQTRYVLAYEDHFTEESQKNCNEQAAQFAIRLKADGKNINENSYYCAMYEPDTEGAVRFEVWFNDDSQ